MRRSCLTPSTSYALTAAVAVTTKNSESDALGQGVFQAFTPDRALGPAHLLGLGPVLGPVTLGREEPLKRHARACRSSEPPEVVAHRGFLNTRSVDGRWWACC